MKKTASPASPGLRARAAGMSADDAVRAQLEGLRPGQSLELLKELHILTREGRINQDSRRKLKQVMHLAHFIEEMLAELPADADFTLVDHGAGKSYLGFVLYDLVCHAHGEQQGRGQVIGIETRADLVQRSRDLAQRLGFQRMRFLPMAAADATQSSELPEQVEMVTALHACDTATDDAIDFALRKAARFIALVPCCQAEVAGRLRAGKALSLARTPLAELWRHPLHTREVGSQLTNVLRCLYLEAMGYQVTVTELVGWEHSLKNELILARHTGQRKRAAAGRLKALLAEFGLSDLIGVRFQLLD
ncbi:MAG: hypothetical protein RL087_1167 [Pseudomonadota bacterium]